MVVGGRRGCLIWGAVASLLVALVVAVGVAARWRNEKEPERRSQTVSLEDQDYRAGDCLTWAQGEDGPEADRAEKVPCSEEHLRDVVAVLQLDDVEGGFPTAEEWEDLEARCHPLTDRYLGRYVSSPLNPVSRATIKPSRDTWARGDRKLVCELGLRQMDLAAKRARVRVPYRGRIRDLDLLSPFEAGDCVRWDDDDFGIVPCTDPHQYEVTGIVDVHAPETKATRVPAADRVGASSCPSRLQSHLGGSVPTGVSSTFIPLEQDDLDGGVRGLVCLGARFLGQDAVELTAPL